MNVNCQEHGNRLKLYKSLRNGNSIVCGNDSGIGITYWLSAIVTNNQINTCFRYVADECSEFSDLGKTAYLSCLYDLSEVNGGNPNNKRRGNNGHFRSRKKEYLECKIKHLEADSKSENDVDLRGRINSFKRVTKLQQTP